MTRFEDVKLYGATPLALLIGPEDDRGEAKWLPRSIIETDLEEVGDVGYVEIPSWKIEDSEIEW